jgi:hypothetical protein
MVLDLRKILPNLLIGIGDCGIDERAYRTSNLLCLIVHEPWDVRPGRFVIKKPDWEAVNNYFVGHHNLLSDPQRLREWLAEGE